MLVERVRIPGLIGLLAGGCIIGPQVLGIVSDTTGVLHELGEVGLLYLMFLAGLELDLGVFARYRNQAIGFMALTFSAPLILGTIGGLLVGYSVAGSVLLGSLFASYTLVAYPIVRNMGLAAQPGRRRHGRRDRADRHPGAGRSWPSSPARRPATPAASS